MGVTPSAFAFSAESTTTAAAPSVIPDEFPAVTVPVFSWKTGASFASPGRSASARGCSSFANSTSPLRPGTFTAKVSAANRPSSHARPALCWLRRAKASCSSRGMRYSLGQGLGGLAHELPAERTQEPVLVHPVHRLLVAHAIAPARAGQEVGHPAHRLDSAREDHLGVAVAYRPEGEVDGLEAAAAGHVHGVGRALPWAPPPDGRPGGPRSGPRRPGGHSRRPSRPRPRRETPARRSDSAAAAAPSSAGVSEAREPPNRPMGVRTAPAMKTSRINAR